MFMVCLVTEKMREVNGKGWDYLQFWIFLSDVTVVKFLLNFEGFFDWLIYVNAKNVLFLLLICIFLVVINLKEWSFILIMYSKLGVTAC